MPVDSTQTSVDGDCWNCCECPCACVGDCTWKWVCPEDPESDPSCDCSDGDCIYIWEPSPPAPGGGHWDLSSTGTCAARCEGSCYCEDEPTEPPDDPDVEQVIIGTCASQPTSLFSLDHHYSGGDCEGGYWELTEDCSESNDSDYQCGGRYCHWLWEVVEEWLDGMEPVYGWTNTADCGSSSCDCAEPAPLSFIEGVSDGGTAVSPCSDNGSGSTGLITCNCDSPLLATPPDEGDEETTPCYGGPLPTPDLSCCTVKGCDWQWDRYLVVEGVQTGGWIINTDECSSGCTDAAGDPVECFCYEPPPCVGCAQDEVMQGICGSETGTEALSSSASVNFGLVNKVPYIRNSPEEIRNSPVLKVTRKGVSKIYLNMKSIKRRRKAIVNKIISRRKRMR